MGSNELSFFKGLFVVSALWNLIGAIFGYFNTAFTFNGFFNRELADPLYYAIYQGAWGTTLVYFIGYSIVAYNPLKHTGIVIVGGIGKVGFAISLFKFYLSGLAGPVVFIVIVGDFIFSILFMYYFFRLYQTKESIL
ncbi:MULTISPECIES: hypothetical protein [unclassified Imperialibacter]|uniref:hypothetical protein n=1 Tax=unclassified Imperialibacter TaxID=2629706 RepID=UPI001257D865|nr:MULTISPECIES: hypothetical protein [unclassified Imperialibacter]CAD5249555.1 conserved membrane hypothetical protein [Imperialibacter sp. 89]CAD5264742.1 conserved membrane hypothetical protein [Imperialibacter sp. 75]VVT06641.1 conserved membrane hypothetical protein [Imperialibacter sp. EC-SDR9]